MRPSVAHGTGNYLEKSQMKYIIFLISLIPLTSQAEVYVRDYLKMKSSPEMVTYLGNVGMGFGWANTELESLNQRPLYCENQALALNGQNFVVLLNDEIANQDRSKVINGKTYLDMPIELALLRKLRKTFPCK